MAIMKTTTFGRLCLTACTTILLASVSASAQNAVYTLVNLGTLGGKRSMGLGINASGHAVGSAETVDGRTHGFVYVNTVPIDLGTFGGDQSYAYRINDQGLIVGRAAAGEEFRPFVSSATGGLFDIS